ncbi:methyltransferase regulatory domain-containing protein [Achromobacter sp. NPDC058515]|uniref:methyltransferase regulatory domain-containing protein n=1 Tax=Achromobacter sp. NPDC058515 TaxID=3346533 RepID=UPI0036645E08
MTAPDHLTQAISDAYDETPYISNPFSYTSPGNLRAVAGLYGLDTPPLENAKVLELGSAAGGNLLPFALAHPGATVVGIDLAPQQIEAGRRIAETAGARNLDLRAMSLTDITADFGTFDYIICHGVFSWVPPEVRDAIFRICRENLAPNGVAYISYNTYPGWKASDVIRDAMILNSFGAETPQQKLARAKDMLDLIENGLWQNNPLQSALQEAARKLRGQTDHYLLHEYLETINTPCYFLEFAAAAQQAGLAYVTDAEPQLTFSSTFGTRVAVGLNSLSANAGREMREQYLDFAVGRTFRKSLLVHAERAEQMLEQPEGNAFKEMHFATHLEAAPPAAGASSGHAHYRTPNGATLSTKDPAMIGIIDALAGVWPRSLSFNDLLAIIEPHAPGATRDDLANAAYMHLITLVQGSALHYRLEASPYLAPETRPRLIAGALELMREVGKKDCQVGMHNFWHHPVTPPLDALSQSVASQMDGSLSAAELRTQIRDALTSGRLAHPNGQSYKGARNLEPVAQEFLNALVVQLRKAGLLLN